jgi:hypothetical protein
MHYLDKPLTQQFDFHESTMLTLHELIIQRGKRIPTTQPAY